MKKLGKKLSTSKKIINTWGRCTCSCSTKYNTYSHENGTGY